MSRPPSKERATMSSQPLDPHRPAPAPPPAPAAGGAPYVRLPKSPGLAAFLSLFPGLGQVYNGQIARAFVFFFALVGSIYLTASGHEFPFAFVIPFVYLFNMIDAWKGATAINAPLPRRPDASRRRTPVSSRRSGAARSAIWASSSSSTTSAGSTSTASPGGGRSS